MNFGQFFWFQAQSKLVESLGNELTINNFIEQGKKDDILVLKKEKECHIEKKGWFGSVKTQIDDTFLNDSYALLFDYLVKKEIIKEKIGIQVYFTTDYTYTINQEFIDSNIIEEKIKSTNEDFPKTLNCYKIHIDRLFNFLKKYKYDPLDEAKIAISQIQGKKPTTGGMKVKRINSKKSKKLNKTFKKRSNKKKTK
jgi:hypothetical protein